MTKEMLEIQDKNIEKFIDIMGNDVSDDIREILINRNFFIAPASIKYHGTYSGALFEHSLKVTEELVCMTQQLNLKWQLERSPYIVGMFHDLCKTDLYVYNEETNTWEYNKNPVWTGHGELSVIIAQQLIKDLTEEELLCIRWHMGAFDEKDNWNKYNAAIEKYPNVLYTHTADMIAARIAGV